MIACPRLSRRHVVGLQRVGHRALSCPSIVLAFSCSSRGPGDRDPDLQHGYEIGNPAAGRLGNRVE